MSSSPLVEVISVPGRGLGLLATHLIPPGRIVMRFSGPVLPVEAITDFTHVLEIAPGLFLGPSGGPDDLVNHSCDPNCAVVSVPGGALLSSACTIHPGDEVTFDYSTTMLTDPTTFICSCGASACRGLVTSWVDLDLMVRDDYRRRGMVPAFILDLEALDQAQQKSHFQVG